MDAIAADPARLCSSPVDRLDAIGAVRPGHRDEAVRPLGREMLAEAKLVEQRNGVDLVHDHFAGVYFCFISIDVN